MDDKKKDNPDPERPPKRNRPQHLKTHNMHTDDVEKHYRHIWGRIFTIR